MGLDINEAMVGQVDEKSSRGFTDEVTRLEDVERVGFSPAESRRLLSKIDRTLLPFLSLLYLLSFLDRSNIGNAKVAGLEKDLHMTSKLDYSTAVAVFFPLYILSEVPSNLAMKQFRPSIWIPSIMTAWAIMTVMMGIVKNYGGLLVVRCVLGLAEGGLFPGISYYITMWYRRHEIGLRIAIFFSAATIAGAFGGLLSRGIMEMDGIGGLHGWSWIFIIEGLITFVVAISAFFFMYDYPSTAKFLTPKEREEVIRRLDEDRSVLSDAFELKFVKDAFLDWKVWAMMVSTIGIFTPLYSVSLFLPTIIEDLGYTESKAQLMSVPPYVVACAVALGCGIGADRMRQRGVFIISSCLVAIVGFIILATVDNTKVKYFACFLVTSGIYSSIPQQTAWNGNNIGGTVKRGVGMAMQIAFGNLGGIFSGYIMYDGPKFTHGFCILIAFISMTLLFSLFLTWWFRRENARRDAEHKAPSAYSQEEMELESDRGDHASFFRYTV